MDIWVIEIPNEPETILKKMMAENLPKLTLTHNSKCTRDSNLINKKKTIISLSQYNCCDKWKAIGNVQREMTHWLQRTERI